jgi:ribosomal protein S18 acetylase RimI-like enzyme
MSVTYFKRYRMHYDLRKPLPPEQPVSIEYDFRPWDESLLVAHARAKYNSFRNELDANVFPCLAQKDGCESLMREIASRNGFVPEATWLVIANSNTGSRPEYCGTVQGINDTGLIGSIQNLGVTPRHRGRGLARGLLIRSLAGFRSIGMETASLEVTARNGHAIRLYQRFGFRVVRTVYKSIEIVGI